MKRNAFLTVCILSTIFAVCGCGGKYGDVKRVNAEFVKATEAYAGDLDNADNPGEVAEAINRYADRMEDLMPRMRKLSEKYPELQGGGDMPPELEASREESEAAGRKMAKSFIKITPHMHDPAVREAQQRLASVMASYQQ
ncbi:MAG: hypothetical protein R6V03_04740 [Kiritimatiellia bacterium]